MSDEKWELVERQVELLRSIADKSPGVLDLQLSVNTAANTVELLKDIAQHEKRRAEEAVAALADQKTANALLMRTTNVISLTAKQQRKRAETAEHEAAFADTYARYYHEHMLAREAGRESQHPYTFDVWYILSDDTGRRARALMHEGELVVSDSEGGFGPDEISIGGDNMSELIARWMGLQLNARGSLAPIKEGRSELGYVRLIMERL